MTRRTTWPAFFTALVAFTCCRSLLGNDQFTVHEWGTFTVLQDEQGRHVPGVNVNDEPLPGFVFRLPQAPVSDAHRLPPPPIAIFAKGVPAALPTATMRLETPVIYIYPPKSGAVPTLDIRVQFRGGWISEWFPDAEVGFPGSTLDIATNANSVPSLSPSTVGEINWSGLTLTSDVRHRAPQTEDHVWLTPRNVSAPRILTRQGNVENYLFYRGVANLEAPLRVAHYEGTRQWLITYQGTPTNGVSSVAFPPMWLVDVRQDRKIAYRRLHPEESVRQDRQLITTTPFEFPVGAYSEVNLTELRASMKSVLIAEGLFDDEADAMLSTWELSYFKSPGLRLFFGVPRSWTDHVLPLEISQPAQVKRVMIGRIELVSPWQRKLLQQMADNPVSKLNWYWDHLQAMSPEKQAEVVKSIRVRPETLVEYGFKVPADYQAFIALGRFREALVRDAVGRQQSPRLREFAEIYAIIRGDTRPAPVAGTN